MTLVTNALMHVSCLQFVATVCHEMGHNNGVGHGSYRDIEYGDPWTVMGAGESKSGGASSGTTFGPRIGTMSCAPSNTASGGTTCIFTAFPRGFPNRLWAGGEKDVYALEVATGPKTVE